MGWYSTMGACEASAQARFDSVARTCAAKPWRAIGANLLLALILGLGFANVEIETKGDRLWVDQQSGLKKQMGYIEDMYATQQRVSFVALGANPTQGGDVLTAAPIADLMTIYERVMALETDDGFTWADACYRDAFGRCTVTGAIAFWSTIQAGINSSLYWHNATTAAVKARVQPPASGDWLYPSGSRVDNSVFLGLDAASAKAEVVRNFFWLQGDFDGRCVKEGLRGEDCTASKREEVQLELEEKMIELIEPYMLHDKEGLAQTVSASSVVYLQAFRSLDDELLRAVSGDIPLFSLTMILMCSFCCIVLGKSGSGSGSKWISSRILLANGGIGLVMFAMIGGYGLCAGLGFEFTQLQQILPFILIGIGVDDMVIIVSALDRVSELEPTLPVATRVGKAFARCGLSITLTSATDITAFLLGSVSKLPAIRLFCLYAAAAILLTYCFMCTGFAAMLALDISRMEGGRYDCCPCICGSLNVVQSATDPAATVAACPSHPLGGGGGGGGVLQRCMAAYARWLLKPLTKAAVLLIFGIALGLNIWGWTETTSGFELIDLTPDDSYVRDSIDMQMRLTGTPNGEIPFSVFTKELTYHEATTQIAYQQLHESLAAAPRVGTATISSWYTSFTSFLNTTQGQATIAPATVGADGRLTGAGSFYPALLTFLELDVMGVKVNKRWSEDLVWADNADPTAGLAAARFHARHPTAVSAVSEQQVECLEEVESLMAASTLEPKPFAWTFFYLFFDQFRTIYDEMMVNFGLCIAAITLICLLVLHQLSVVVLTGLLITMIDVDLIGSIHFWGLEVNSISVINLVMAVGLVVDYSAHVIHNFGLQRQAATRDEAVAAMLVEIGPPVLLGGATTLIGIAPLSLASSTIFRTFFKMFFSIIVYGIGHGLILMPVVLSLLGGRAAQVATKEADVVGEPNMEQNGGELGA